MNERNTYIQHSPQKFGAPVAYAIIQNVTYIDHIHQSYELMLVLDGEADIFLNQTHYNARPGDLFFIGCNILHSYATKQSSRVLVLGCMPEEVPVFTKALLSPNTFYVLSNNGNHQNDSLYTLVDQLLLHPEAMKNDTMLTGCLNLMFSYVLDACCSDTPKLFPMQHPFEKALCFIEQHAPAPLSLETVANAAGVSKYYLSRCFHQNLGIGFPLYLDVISVNAARRMLVQTDFPIQDIMAACGYQNMRSFDRSFQKLSGLSPREYRKKWKPLHLIDYTTPIIREVICRRYGL